MLRSTTMAGLLRSIFDHTEAAADAYRMPNPGDLDDLAGLDPEDVPDDQAPDDSGNDDDSGPHQDRPRP
jgi:hypothetical protein